MILNNIHNSKNDYSYNSFTESEVNGQQSHHTAMARDEIIARRKLKVIEIRQRKKMQSYQEKSAASSEHTKTDFSLEKYSDEFPSLSFKSSWKKKYKLNINNFCNGESGEDDLMQQKKATSWKPKVKDPIAIDIGQALQNNPEKCKVVTKKVGPSQHNVSKGNILDSDNPQQKKGKVRPDKKKRPTKLKKQIICERIERKKLVQGENISNPSLVKPVVILKGSSVLANVMIEQIQVENPCSNLNEDISSLLSSCTIGEEEENLSSKYSNLNNQKEIVKPEPTKIVHSRRFREYVTNCLTEDVVSRVCVLLEKLAYFQDRTFDRYPIKAQAKRRYVAGIKQTKKYLLIKKVKLLVIAPDLESVPGEGGLDDIVQHLKNEAFKQDVPYVFGPKRKHLGKAVSKKSLVSCVAVLSYEGAEEQFSRVLESLEDATFKYKALTNENTFNVSEKIEEEASTSPKSKDTVSTSEVTKNDLVVLKGNLSESRLKAVHDTAVNS